MAETCISELEPDLIIMDEFQRFKYLLNGDDDISTLAHSLFNYEDVKLLLLSATPYKMYTMYHESEEDNHYQDLIRTVDFLFNDEEKTVNFKANLKKYRRELFNINVNGTNKLKQVKDKIEDELSKIMVRNERINVSKHQNAMLNQSAKEDPHLSPLELNSFAMVDQISDILDAGNIINYWKSAPYLLNFMDKKGYKLKREFIAALGDPDKSEEIKKVLNKSKDSLLK